MCILPAIEAIVGNQETCDENKLILNLINNYSQPVCYSIKFFSYISAQLGPCELLLMKVCP